MNKEFYFIAEIGVNHGGKLDKALEMVEQAAAAGADAAKFQVYKAEKLVVSSALAYWDRSFEKEQTQQELFKKFDGLNDEDYHIIHEKCKECGIDFLATPFDLDAVEMLDPISNAFKIASADITNLPLLRAVAKKKKHVFISAGAASIAEIEFALDELISGGATSLSLLHCVLNYPCKISNSHLGNIRNLQKHFESDIVKIGFSDHIPSFEAGDDQLIIAASMGCRVFERHFTYNTELEGNDHYHALDENGLAGVIERISNAIDATKPVTEEKLLRNQKDAILQARRSVVAARPIFAGQIIEPKDLIAKRPGTGISPTMIDEILQKRAKVDMETDHILHWDDLEESE